MTNEKRADIIEKARQDFMRGKITAAQYSNIRQTQLQAIIENNKKKGGIDMTNIAEILKNAPKGLKLYCTMVGECELSYINEKEIVIKYNKKDETFALALNEFGRWENGGECLLFPCYNRYDWNDWQYNILTDNKGIVIIDKNTGYRYITVNHDSYNFAICDVSGKIHTEISPIDFCFADADTEFRFLNQLRENGYYYNDGNIYEDNKEHKNIKNASCNDYKKIIEHYGVREQLKKLSEEVYELQEAVIERGLVNFNNEHVIEELADVFVLLFQLQEFYGISKYEISDMVCYKVERTLKRIKKEVENE